MDIIISNSSPEPIYLQIKNQIKSQIIKNELAEGDALASMRVLAKELRISLITTKRAYEELERDGFICTVAGKGCFVASKNTELLLEDHLKEIHQLLLQVFQLSQLSDISYEKILEMIALIYKKED